MEENFVSHNAIGTLTIIDFSVPLLLKCDMSTINKQSERLKHSNLDLTIKRRQKPVRSNVEMEVYCKPQLTLFRVTNGGTRDINNRIKKIRTVNISSRFIQILATLIYTNIDNQAKAFTMYLFSSLYRRSFKKMISRGPYEVIITN